MFHFLREFLFKRLTQRIHHPGFMGHHGEILEFIYVGTLFGDRGSVAII